MATAANIFLKLEGINGGVADGDYKGQIRLESWGWGMSNHGSDLHSTDGSGSNTGSKAQIHDIEVTKNVDVASPNLVQAVCHHQSFDNATITMADQSGTPLCVIKMTKVRIRGLDMHNHSGMNMTETFVLHFKEFEFTYQPVDADGKKKGGAVSTKMDIAAGPKKKL